MLLIGSSSAWAVVSDTQTETTIARSGSGTSSSPYVYYETATDIEDAMAADNNVRSFKIYPVFSSVEVINISNPNQNGVWFTLDGDGIDLSNTIINVKEGCKFYFSASSSTKNVTNGVFNVETGAKLTLQYGIYNGTVAKCIGAGTINTSSNVTYDNVSFENTNGGEILITDGTFTTDITINGTASITGGIFYASVMDKVRTFVNNETCTIFPYEKDAEGGVVSYKVWKNSSITAMVNGVPYTDFGTAFDASSKDYPVILMNNCSFYQYKTISTSGVTRWIDLNGKTLECSPMSTNYSFKVSKGKLKITDCSDDKSGLLKGKYIAENGAIIFLYGSTTSTATNYSILEIGEGVKIDNQSSSPTYIAAVLHLGTSTKNKAAYGAVINIGQNTSLSCTNGSILSINGNVNKTSGNVPQINIADGASLDTGCDKEACIYAGGYGIWNIGAATLKSNTPIYAKSGIVNVNGAAIEACGEFAEPVANSNGFNPTGDAIMIDSNSSYAGNVQLSISGDTKITSQNGYAVQEALTKMDDTKAIKLEIVNGSFSGAKGSIKLSDEFAAALAQGATAGGKWVLNAVTNGKYSAMPEVVADGYMVKMTSDAQFPYEVVEKKDDAGITDITAITEDKTESGDYTVKKGTALIVRTGNTLKVNGKLFIGENENWPAQVTVEPGATLIAGNGIEINASNEDLYKNALVLQADKENGAASLLFGTGATGDVNPVASVEMYMYGHLLSEGADETNPQNFKWQHFGLPIYSDGDIEKTMPVWYFDWNVKNGWVRVSGADIKGEGPWAIHNTTTNLVNEGSKFVFKGNLIGSQNVTTTLDRAGYFGFANSYTAPLSMENVIAKLQEKGLEAGIWLYDASGNLAEFTAYSLGDIEDDGDKGVLPMQAFFMYNKAGGSKSIEINYASDVYNFKPVDGSAGAAYRAADADVNGGKITLSDGVEAATLTIREAERFSDEYDNGYDMYQMESTGMIQIYAIQGESKLASIATNSINGKEIAIVTKANTEYTLSFSKLKGNAFKLTDIASGAEIEVGEDKTYTFTAAANSTITRFRLGEGEVSANEADANAINVWVANEALNVAGAAEGDAIEIINLAGVRVLSATATGEAVQTISLSGIANGAYIVKAGATTVKVIK